MWSAAVEHFSAAEERSVVVFSAGVETSVVILLITILEFLLTLDDITRLLKALPINTYNISIAQFPTSFEDHAFAILLFFCFHFHHWPLSFSVSLVFLENVVLVYFELRLLPCAVEVLELGFQALFLQQQVLRVGLGFQLEFGYV